MKNTKKTDFKLKELIDLSKFPKTAIDALKDVLCLSDELTNFSELPFRKKSVYENVFFCVFGAVFAPETVHKISDPDSKKFHNVWRFVTAAMYHRGTSKNYFTKKYLEVLEERLTIVDRETKLYLFKEIKKEIEKLHGLSEEELINKIDRESKDGFIECVAKKVVRESRSK